MMQDFVGKQIDRYRITERLGVGGMAVVYQAYDTRLEREVALKLIRTEAIPQEQHNRLMKRFEREAKAQASFDYRHIVPVHDYGEVDGTLYLVMAIIPGGTLKERIGRPLGYRQAIELLLPVAQALAYAHNRGVVHRDVKPSNILFDEDGQPMLTDFGIAKLLETDEATLTSPGIGVGTPEYMAPEQWRGQALPATDQYALGVVLYELITGERPYRANTPAGVAIMQATQPFLSPRVLVPGIPEGVEKLLYKVLARDPQDRYEDMVAFREALEKQLVGKSGQASEIEYTPFPKSIAVPAESESLLSSGAEAADELLSTPIEGVPVQTIVKTSQFSGRAEAGGMGLLSCLLWAGGAVLVLFLLAGGLVLLYRGSRGSLSVAEAEPTKETVAQIETILPIVTEALLPTIETPLKTATEAQVLTPTLTPDTTLGIYLTLVNPIDGAVMVYVPEGEFLMGSEDSHADSDEAPERQVWLDDFWIYQTEVTNEMYQQCVEEGACDLPGTTTYYQNPRFAEHPVDYVNWFNAVAYCQWAGGQLPTEAEWEKAARGTDGRIFSWGDQIGGCDLANTGGCIGGTTPVGSYPAGASLYGALDMVGNVWEWVADWYADDYYRRAPYENPSGPESGIYRVARGGGWHRTPMISFLSVSHRNYSDPDKGAAGFRCLHRAAP